MTILYKLTSQDKKTKENTLWGEGISHSGTGKGPLCSQGWVHAYRHPLLAVFLNPIHANFKNPLLWEAEGEVIKDDGLKVGCKTLTTLKQIELPQMTTEQRICCGILIAKAVYREEQWNEWAEKWLSGEDRSRSSACAAAADATYIADYADAAVAHAADAIAYIAACAAAGTVAYAVACAAALTATHAIKSMSIDILPILKKVMEE